VNPILLAVIAALAALQMKLPRAWAFAPLLVAACHTPYMPFAAGLTATRVIILLGILRAMKEGWFAWSIGESRDRMMLVFAGLALLSTVAHGWEYDNPLTSRMRFVLDVCGAFLYARAFLYENASISRFATVLACVLTPLALMMVIEARSGRNPYVFIGVAKTFSLVREGGFRPQGPFGTPILAGTAGASAIPLLAMLWWENRRVALLGLGAALTIVYCSASSGPIGTTMIGLGAIALWPLRANLRAFIAAGVVFLVFVHFIREKPVWHLMTLIDFVGGSTGWHRAYLIDMAVKHMGEWWFLGTDYTRHWLPYALATVPNHCDLTNYYIHLGVMGGLPLVLCLLVILWKTFRLVLGAVSKIGGAGTVAEFRLWCLGAALLGHAVTFLSISYFDQMSFFFWLLIGGAAGFVADAVSGDSREENAEPKPDPRAGWVGEWAPGLYRRQ
jgi:hypothetical protein